MPREKPRSKNAVREHPSVSPKKIDGRFVRPRKSVFIRVHLWLDCIVPAKSDEVYLRPPLNLERPLQIQPRYRPRRANSRCSFLRANSCSQMRSTVQPLARRVRFTRRLRALLPESLASQKAALALGFVLHFAQPCQTQRRRARSYRRSFKFLICYAS